MVPGDFIRFPMLLIILTAHICNVCKETMKREKNQGLLRDLFEGWPCTCKAIKAARELTGGPIYQIGRFGELYENENVALAHETLKNSWRRKNRSNRLAIIGIPLVIRGVG